MDDRPIEGLRDYIEHLRQQGYSVRDGHTPDPDLIDPQGNPVYTWQEGYPYAERMDRDAYELEKYWLQVELLKFQYWLEDNGQRAIILFEGRDAAGKGGTIKRFTEYLNPRTARTVALTMPTERERGQWYFQRYVQHLPTKGEMVMFDRSWYNRAGVERVMGYCTDQEYEDFMVQAPNFEKMLVDSGIHVTKFWFSVSRTEQRTRFAIRQLDPVRRWKLVAQRPRIARSVGGLHGGEGGDVPTHRQEARGVDDHPLERQEARAAQRDAVLPRPVRLRGQKR